MGIAQWMRVLDTVGSLAQAGARLKESVMPTPSRRADAEGTDLSTEPAAGGLETRLAGVLVAALHEAFDRDKARTDLERQTLEADRARAERALQAELRRQAADRALAHLRLIAIFGGCLLLSSAALAAFIPAMRDGSAALVLGTGWAAALATLGCVFAAWPQVSGWASGESPGTDRSPVAAAAPWLLLVSLALVAASLLTA